MKRYIIIKCPKFSKLSFDNILGVKDIVPKIKDNGAKKKIVIQYLIGQYSWAMYICMYVYLIRKYIYLEEYDLDIFKIYLWCICFIFFGGY